MDGLQRDVALVGDTCGPMKLLELVRAVFELGQRYYWLLSQFIAALRKVLVLRISEASKHAGPVNLALPSGVARKDEDMLDSLVMDEVAWSRSMLANDTRRQGSWEFVEASLPGDFSLMFAVDIGWRAMTACTGSWVECLVAPFVVQWSLPQES